MSTLPADRRAPPDGAGATPPAASAPAPGAGPQALADAPPALVLVGNPNVGKSALFGALTGRYATVSNYPGTTVEVTRGSAQLGGRAWRVLDTPGTNNLLPMSEDEAVTRDILLVERGATCLQVCDAKNLRRGLLLSAQLAEAGVPFALALNMADEAAARGIRIDLEKLAGRLGVETVATVAVQRRGLAALEAKLGQARPSAFRPRYDEAIESALAELTPLMPADTGLSARSIALMALAGDDSLRAVLVERLAPASLERLDEARRQLAARYKESLRFVLARQRLASVDALHDEVVSRLERPSVAPGRRLAALTTHPVWGVPVLLAVLYACYQFVGVFGAGTCVDFLEERVFQGWVVPGMRWLIGLLPAGAFADFLGPPAGVAPESHGGLLVGRYGVVSMGLSYGIAIVLPIVTTFFVAFSLLEDSGYLPRLAVMLNRVFKRMGLNGRAVLPMVLGLGCDTMATMTTRILETRKERVIVTLLLALGVPCSAQLAVIFAMLAGVSGAAALWFAGAIALVLFLVGWLAAKVLPGRGSDFILELPPLRVPQARNIAIKTVARIEWYLREALPLFVLGTFLLWLLDRFGGLQLMERALSPVVSGLLHLPPQAASAFILGFLRRDYAAAGLFAHYEPHMKAGTMTASMEIEVVVALTTVTLFIPCIANFFMIVKERGWRTGAAIAGFILPFSIGVGAVVDRLMRWVY